MDSSLLNMSRTIWFMTTIIALCTLFLDVTADKQGTKSGHYSGSPPLPVCIGQTIPNPASVKKCLPSMTLCAGEGTTSCCIYNGYDYYCCPKKDKMECPKYANVKGWVKTWQAVHTYDDGLFYRQIFQPIGPKAAASQSSTTTTAKPAAAAINRRLKEADSDESAANETESNALVSSTGKKATKVQTKLIEEKSPKTVTTSKKPAQDNKTTSKKKNEKPPSTPKPKKKNDSKSKSSEKSGKKSDKMADKPKSNESSKSKNSQKKSKKKSAEKSKNKKDSKKESKTESKQDKSSSGLSKEELEILVGQGTGVNPNRIARLLNQPRKIFNSISTRNRLNTASSSGKSPVISISKSVPIVTLEQLNGNLEAEFVASSRSGENLKIATKKKSRKSPSSKNSQKNKKVDGEESIKKVSSTKVSSTKVVSSPTVASTTDRGDESTTVAETTVDQTTTEATQTTEAEQTTEEVTSETLEPTESIDLKDTNDPLEFKFLEDKFRKIPSSQVTFSPILRQMLLSHRSKNQPEFSGSREPEGVIKLSKPTMLPLGFNLDSAPLISPIHQFNQSATSNISAIESQVLKPTNKQPVPVSIDQSEHSKSMIISSTNQNEAGTMELSINNNNTLSNDDGSTVNQPLGFKISNINPPITTGLFGSLDTQTQPIKYNSLLTPTIRNLILRARQMEKQPKEQDILRNR